MYAGTNVYYDDFLLNQYITIQNIETRLLPKVSNNYQGLPHRSGTRHLFGVYGQISVKIDYTIKHDILAVKDTLNRILFTKRDKKLVIGDQLDRYLLCRVDGDTKLSSRVIKSEGTLEFLSPDHFWRATSGNDLYEFNIEGRVVADNRGTAPTEPVIVINFESDCGYMAVVAPNGYISIGNPYEEDEIKVPPSEFAVNQNFTSTTGWTQELDGATLIPDYVKLSSSGTAKFDSMGMSVNPTTLGTTDQWHGHMYSKVFDSGAAELEADNFNLEADLDIYDLSGKRTNTTATLIVVMDAQNNPIMSTSIYDVSKDRNELTVTFKVLDTTKPKHSKIIYSNKISQLDGTVKMSKIGPQFEWTVNTMANQSTSTQPKQLKVGDIVQLNNDVKHIYDWNGTRLWLDKRIIGQDLKLTQISTSGPNKGRYLLNNVRYGYVEGFFNRQDIKQASVQTTTVKRPTELRHAITDSGLAQLRPAKVIVWQAKWGATNPYSMSRINKLSVKRLYTDTSYQIENTFKEGDVLIIDNQTERITLNGIEFDGFIDVDSRFFDLDGGQSEIVLLPSEWASMPNATIELESRWF